MGTISSTVYPDLKLVHFRCLGDISHDMLIGEIRKLHAHPEWNFSFNTFIDFNKAIVNNETDSIAKYQSYYRTLQPTTLVRKWAICTQQDTSHKAFDRSRLPVLPNIIIDVFQSRDEALKFLDIQPNQFVETTDMD